ncbi:MAG: erythromycin esterase family protein [Candidatus Cloacimonetes bacterium]|nr:erythromycin esterase family protein [Candidatus Cloacimonadota bacterium]
MCKDNQESKYKISDNILNYLSQNYEHLSLSNQENSNSLSMLESDLNKNQIFLTGEVHNIKINSKLKMNFIKYFKQKLNFKYLLCEYSYSMSYFLNQYLRSGNDKILKEIYEPLSDSLGTNQDIYDHWKFLYKYNLTLNYNDRIQVIGVDIEHQPINAYKFLIEILPEHNIPKIIESKIKNIRTIYKDLQNNNYTSYYNSAKELQTDIRNNTSSYEEFLGSNLYSFKLVVNNILNSVDAYKFEDNEAEWNNYRDQKIFENFCLIESQLPEGNFYGQLGASHIFQSKDNDVMWFAAHLNSPTSKYTNKVISILFNYIDCEMGYREEIYSTTPFNYVFPYLETVNKTLGGKINIYKLNSNDVPFSEMMMYDIYSGNETDESVVNFIQYIVVIKNSEASKPLYVF